MELTPKEVAICVEVFWKLGKHPVTLQGIYEITNIMNSPEGSFLWDLWEKVDAHFTEPTGPITIQKPEPDPFWNEPDMDAHESHDGGHTWT